MIDIEALHRGRHRLTEAQNLLHRVRVTSERVANVAEVGRCLVALEEVTRRVNRILTSPLALDPLPRNTALTAIIDDWIADVKWWARSTTFDSTPIDSVVRMMAAHDPTRDALMDSMIERESLHLTALLFSTTDISEVRDLWIRATDPRSVNPEKARIRIEAVAAAVFAEPNARKVFSGARLDVRALAQRRSELREMLGSMAEPWILYFTGLSARWNGDPVAGRDRLRQIADHDAAARRLRTALGPAIERDFRDLPLEHEARMTRIDQIAFAVGASIEILRDVDVERARRETATRAALLSIPTHLPLGLSWPAGKALEAVTTTLAGRMDTRQDVAERSARTEHHDRERLARVAETSARRAAVEDGLMDPDSAHVPADVRVQIQHAADAISNAADLGDAFAER